VQDDGFPELREDFSYGPPPRRNAMLYKCANEACSTPFRRLREGKLFQVETEYFAQPQAGSGARRTRPWRRVEHYWLCDTCSSFVTLTFDRERGVITVPLPDGVGKRTVKLISPPEGAKLRETLPPRDSMQQTQTLREVAK
jgi:hypothetical protein